MYLHLLIRAFEGHRHKLEALCNRKIKYSLVYKVNIELIIIWHSFVATGKLQWEKTNKYIAKRSRLSFTS